MGATPLYLAIILAQANTYLRASVTLRLNSTVEMSNLHNPYSATVLYD